MFGDKGVKSGLSLRTKDAYGKETSQTGLNVSGDALLAITFFSRTVLGSS